MKIIRFVTLFIGISFLVACVSSVQQQTKQNNHKPATIILKPQIHKKTPPLFLSKIKPSKRKPKWIPRPTLSHKKRFAATLEAHNKVRIRHRLPPLTWSNKLAQYSQQWANQLAKGNHCQMYHRSGKPPFGENLYRSTAIIWTDGRREINPVTIKEVVKAWANEEKWYDIKRNRCQPGRQCGHYTQIVWKNTREVGCAMQVCADKSQTWVCSYNPAGNYIGVKPY